MKKPALLIAPSDARSLSLLYPGECHSVLPISPAVTSSSPSFCNESSVRPFDFKEDRLRYSDLFGNVLLIRCGSKTLSRCFHLK